MYELAAVFSPRNTKEEIEQTLDNLEGEIEDIGLNVKHTSKVEELKAPSLVDYANKAYVGFVYMEKGEDVPKNFNQQVEKEFNLSDPVERILITKTDEVVEDDENPVFKSSLQINKGKKEDKEKSKSKKDKDKDKKEKKSKKKDKTKESKKGKDDKEESKKKEEEKDEDVSEEEIDEQLDEKLDEIT